MTSPSSAAGLARRLVHYARPRQLQLVTCLCEVGSIQKAALVLGMSQPTATQALTRLEQLLGVTLFDRHARGTRLTREGALLMPSVRRTLTSIEALATDAATVREGASGLIRVAGIAAASTAVAAPTLSELLAMHPELWIEYREIDAAQIPALCTDDGADLVLCRASTVVPEGYEFVPLRSDRLGVYCASDHPLAARRRLTLRHCTEAIWLVPPSESPPHRAFVRWCEQNAMTPKVARINTRTISVSVALVRRLQLLYVGIDSQLCRFVDSGQLQRLPLDVPGALDDIGLLRPTVARSAAVELAARHLVAWARR